MTEPHRHRFYRVTLRGIPLTRWRCSCGLRAVPVAVVRALEGTVLVGADHLRALPETTYDASLLTPTWERITYGPDGTRTVEPIPPCGHHPMVPGCGGCDPGAIEFVIEDGTRTLRPYDPTRDERPTTP